MLSKIKGALLGGHFQYYITRDQEYFIKICWDKEWISKEFFNLKKYWNKLNINNLNLAEPIKYSLEKNYLITRFVKGKRLIELLNPNIHRQFGKLLRNFHNKGFTHSHIELTDVIYKDGRFTLVDVPFFNEKLPIHDLATIGICFKIFRLKQPWNWYKFNICYREFLSGYNLKEFSDYKNEYQTSFNKRMDYFIRTGKKNKIKAYIMKLFFKIGLL